MEGARYPGDSRLVCLIYLSYPLHSNLVGLNANLEVVTLQMHCQLKLRRSPCSVSFCFKAEIGDTSRAEIVFLSCVCLYLMLDCNGFEGLHQYRFSFIYPNLLLRWHFRPAARHFTDLSLKWSFLWFPEQSFVLEDFSDFFCVKFFRLLMKGKSSSRKSAFFSWWWPIAFTPTSAFLFASELGFTVSLKCSNFAVECDWNRILKPIKISGFFRNLEGFFRTKFWNISKSLNVANF